MSVRLHKWKAKDGEREAWVCQYSTDQKDHRGKRRRHLKFFKTKTEARNFEAQTRIDVGKGVHVPASKSPTVDAAGKLWIASCSNLERTTRRGYEQHLRDYIVPQLGSLKLSSLNVGVLREWQDRLTANGLSPTMVKKVRTSLGSLLADAVDRGKIGTNAVWSMRANRKRGKERQAERRARGKLKSGTDIPTPAEIEALLAVVTGRWRPLLLTAIRCGLRSSEIRGLRWSDIDFDAKELHVAQRADAFNKIGWPKSGDGQRTIPIPRTTLAALRDWEKKCPKGALNLVFPNGHGNIENHGNIVERGLIPTWERAGVVGRYSGLHCLRHYYASWCLARPPIGLGLTLKEVSERMGHSTIVLTADTYSHLLPRDDESAALAAAESKFG